MCKKDKKLIAESPSPIVSTAVPEAKKSRRFLLPHDNLESDDIDSVTKSVVKLHGEVTYQQKHQTNKIINLSIKISCPILSITEDILTKQACNK